MTPLFSGIYLLYRYITNHGEGEDKGDDGRTAFSRYHERDASVRASIGVSAFFFFLSFVTLSHAPLLAWSGQAGFFGFGWLSGFCSFVCSYLGVGKICCRAFFILFYHQSVNRLVNQSAQLSTSQAGGRMPSIYIYFSNFFSLCFSSVSGEWAGSEVGRQSFSSSSSSSSSGRFRCSGRQSFGLSYLEAGGHSTVSVGAPLH